MEKYSVLATLVEKIEVLSTTDKLERAGISVRVESIKIEASTGSALGYRLRVPQKQIQNALAVIQENSLGLMH